MASAYDDNNMSKHNLRFSDIANEPLKVLLPIEGYERMPLVSLEEAVDPLLHFVPDIRRKVWVAKENCDNPTDGLSPDESASICIYSMEWLPHDECLYFVLNATLRDKNRDKLKPWFLYLKLLLTALARLPSSRNTVYRGVKLDLIKDYPTGKTFVWWGFSSCTSSIAVLQSELFLGKTETRTMFTIDCFSGKDIRRHSYYETENEVLLPAATQFQVIASLDQGNGFHIIQLKETDPPFPLIEPVLALNPPLSIKPLNQSNKKSTSLIVKAMTASPDKYRNPKLKALIDTFSSQSPVDLRHQQMTDRDMQIVIQEAIINKQCTSLWLEDNNISWKGASTLASALQNSIELNVLWLNNNHVSDKGVQFLAQALSLNNSSLNTLDLGDDSIRDEGAQHLAEMLKKNTTLTRLYLSKNRISDEGIKLLANALAHYNTTLELLDLHANRLVSDSSTDSLVHMLKHNQSLGKLSVRDCDLSWNSKAKLREAVKEKPNFALRT